MLLLVHGAMWRGLFSSLASFVPRTHPTQKEKGEVSAPSGKEEDVSTWDLLPFHRQCVLCPHKVSALPPGDRWVKGKVHMDFNPFFPQKSVFKLKGLNVIFK